jgi:pyruvate dehydrogenase E2 component (dihydrolipoamide acetyltransferase)
MADVLMPRLSDAMEQGTILRWLVKPGALVRPGEPLVEIETDKATMTFEAGEAGVVEILAGIGDTLPVGGLIARIDPDAEPVTAPVPVAVAPVVAAPAPRQTAKGEVTVEELSRSQQAVVRRMSESKATVPDFHVTTEVDMTAAVAWRARAASPAPTANDLVVKAAALALRAFPRVNGAYRDGRFERYERVNVGIAVAVPDALLVPTIFDADRRPLAEIAALSATAAERARSGAITPPELSGGTFTVTNLGMLGVTSFTAIINPPQAANLTVGAIVARVVPVGQDVVVRQIMALTLVCDHRILYGADAARFLAKVRELLEAPEGLEHHG